MFKKIISFLIIFCLSSICLHDTGFAVYDNTTQNSCTSHHCVNTWHSNQTDICLVGIKLKSENTLSKTNKKQFFYTLIDLEKEKTIPWKKGVQKKIVKIFDYTDKQKYTELIWIVKQIK